MVAFMTESSPWSGDFKHICDWTVISTIGKGCDSQVVKAKNSTGEIVCFLSFFFAAVSFLILLSSTIPGSH